MIKLFRNIRKKLLREGKATNYLKYAIGEIVLVVIGILIALQINNWNSNRIQNTNELLLSKRLLEETQRNLVTLRTDSLIAETSRSSALNILHLIGLDTNQVARRTLDSLVFKILASPSLDFNSSVLDEALSTGQVANFKNDSLKDIIYTLPAKLQKVKEREKIIDEESNKHLVPLIYEFTSLRNIDYTFSRKGKIIGPSTLEPIDNRNILALRKFENIVDNQYYLYNELIDQYSEFGNIIQDLNRLLQEELKKQ